MASVAACHEVVVHILDHVHPFHGDAGLAGVVATPAHGAVRGFLHVGVFEDDHGVLAAHLEDERFERVGGLSVDAFADLGAPGEGDDVGRRPDQGGPGVAGPVDDLDDPSGIPAFRAQVLR